MTPYANYTKGEHLHTNPNGSEVKIALLFPPGTTPQLKVYQSVTIGENVQLIFAFGESIHIGNYTNIGNDTTVATKFIYGATKVGSNCTITCNHLPMNTAIGNRTEAHLTIDSRNAKVRIGSDCKIGASLLYTKPKKCELYGSPESLFIGNHVTVGEDCTFQNFVEIPDNATIPAKARLDNHFNYTVANGLTMASSSQSGITYLGAANSSTGEMQTLVAMIAPRLIEQATELAELKKVFTPEGLGRLNKLLKLVNTPQAMELVEAVTHVLTRQKSTSH